MSSLRDLILREQYELAAHRLLFGVVSLLAQTSCPGVTTQSPQTAPQAGSEDSERSKGSEGGGEA